MTVNKLKATATLMVAMGTLMASPAHAGKTLDGINRERREIEGGMREQAFAIAESLFDESEEPPPAICVFDPDFHEGVVGISLFMGGDSTSSSAVVQTAGHAYRLHRHKLMQAFNRADAFQRLLLRYTQALITQMAQTAVCNRHHSLDQQLCRWLLLSLDRLQGHELTMTQELISNMLGVRREGVTEAAMQLQAAGLIRYSRGKISVLDRSGLERRTCECYAVVKKEYDRLLPEKMAI